MSNSFEVHRALEQGDTLTPLFLCVGICNTENKRTKDTNI